MLEDGTRTAPAKITKLNETQTNAWYEVSAAPGTESTGAADV